MFNAKKAQGPSARITAGVKTAVIVLVLGVVALIADVSLTSPRALLLEDAKGVPAEVAAISPGVHSATAAAVPVRPDSVGATRSTPVDPSVPAAASLLFPKDTDDVQPPTF